MIVGQEVTHDSRGTGKIVFIGEDFIRVFFDDDQKEGTIFNDSCLLTYLDSGDYVFQAPPIYTVAAKKHQRQDEDSSLMKYTVDYDRATRPWVFTEWFPELAWIMGFAAEKNAYLRWSGQLDKESLSKEVDDDAFEVGSDSNGEKFDVVMPNPNYLGLDDKLDINFVQRGGRKKVSLNKEGFFHFLEEHGFEVGKGITQDVLRVRGQVPVDYQSYFDMGTRETIVK